MKNKKKIELWTVYRGSGRPDRFLGEFSSKDEAFKAGYDHMEKHPCDEIGVGNPKPDAEGFLQWVD